MTAVWGVYDAVVQNSHDPAGNMRAKLKIPQVLGTAVSNWARPAGNATGSAPVSGTPVFAMFAGGDVNYPVYVIREQVLPNSVDWINVVNQYDADPSGVLDSTAAIQAALNAAAPGQPVYLPSGIYKTTAPLIIPPGGVLMGDFANEVATYLDALYGTVIQPAATWAQGTCPANGVVVALNQTDGGYAVQSEEQKIFGLMIDCHLMTGSTTDGIQLYGGVARVHIERVEISHPDNNGLNLVFTGGSSAGAIRCVRMNVRFPGNFGVLHDRGSDGSYIDCLVENAVSDGWNITNLSNGMLIGTRSEHNGGNAYKYICTNSSTGSGTAMFNGISSDRCTQNGIFITTTNGSGVPVHLTGCRFRRDGENSSAGGGGFGGIVISGYPGTVIVDGTVVFPGVGDGGGGTNSPQYGMVISSCSNKTFILVSGSHIQGQQACWLNDNSANVQLDNSTVWASGTTGSPVIAARPVFTNVPLGPTGASMESSTGLIQRVSGSQQSSVNGSASITTAGLTLVGSMTVPASEVEANSAFIISASGTFTTGATVPGGAAVGIYWGGTGGVQLASLAVPTLNANLTNLGWTLDAETVFLSTTEAWTKMILGWHTAGGPAGSAFWMFNNDVTGLVSTINKDLALSFTWTAGAGGWSGTFATKACRIGRVA